LKTINNQPTNNVVPFRQKTKYEIATTFNKQAIIDSLEKPFYLFDFSEWAELSKSDPQQFEQRRKEVIERQMSQCREQNIPRIKGLQWRIEQERKLASSSMDSCIRIYNMMWDHVLADNGMLKALQSI